MSAPVTPCAPEATLAFIEGRFGAKAVQLLDPSCRLATLRGRRITELRRCSELRPAERYGWLSLTGWLLGMKAITVGRFDPSSMAINHRASRGDVLPDPLGDDPAPRLLAIGDTQLEVSDPRDPLGYRLVELAAAASCDGLVDLDGRQVGGGAVAASLRARLEEVSLG
jgi:hypothetical protein